MGAVVGYIVAVLAIAGFFVWQHRQSKAEPTSKQLADWLETVEADGLLEEFEYSAVDKLFPPRLKAKYRAAYRKQRNQYTARAITLAVIQRDQAAGRAISSRQLEILQREGLLGAKAESKTPFPPMEGAKGEENEN